MPDTFQNGDHLLPTDRLWPDSEKGPWVLTFHWQVLNGRAECVGMDMVSALPPEAFRYRGKDGEPPAGMTLPPIGTPLRTSTLRALNLAEILTEEREKAYKMWSERFQWPDFAEPFVPRETTMRASTLRRLKRVAEVYRTAWQKGDPPTKAVAKRLGITEAAASGLVSRARTAGLLPPTSPGVAAAETQQ